MYAFKSDGVEWDLGTIGLSFTPVTAVEQGPFDEIRHTFRPDQEPPNTLLSYSFLGLTLAPWLFLLGLVWVLM